MHQMSGGDQGYEETRARVKQRRAAECGRGGGHIVEKVTTEGLLRRSRELNQVR